MLFTFKVGYIAKGNVCDSTLMIFAYMTFPFHETVLKTAQNRRKLPKTAENCYTFSP